LDITLAVKQLFGDDIVDQRWRRARPELTSLAKATHGYDITVIKPTTENKLSMYAVLLKKRLSFWT
jgi:hypothetical protein